MLRESGLDWVADNHLADFCKQKLNQAGQYIEIEGKRIRIGSSDEKSRKATSNKWFETQDSISYWDDFSKPQIVWLELTDLPKFSLVKDMVSLNTVFFMTGEHLNHIIGFLNSTVITWYFHNCLGARSGTGTNRWLKYTIEQLPIPPVCERIVDIVGESNITTKSESEEINEVCMDIFTLTEEEKAVVRSFVIK